MFKINGVEWKITAVPADSIQLFRSDGSQSVAVCDNNVRTIYVNNELKGHMLRKVLCHEITHAAMFSYGVDLTLDQEELLADLVATYGDEIIQVTNKIFNKIKMGG